MDTKYIIAVVVVVILLIIYYYMSLDGVTEEQKKAHNAFLKSYILDNNWAFGPIKVAGVGEEIGYRWINEPQIYKNGKWSKVGNQQAAYNALKLN